MMPIGFLTTTERERLSRFPAQIPDENLGVFFLLSDADQTAINKQREAHTRLGFAMQLCALRYLGFAPDALSTPRGTRSSMSRSNSPSRLTPSPSMAAGFLPAHSTSSRSKPIWVFALPPRWISMPCKYG